MLLVMLVRVMEDERRQFKHTAMNVNGESILGEEKKKCVT